MCQLGVRNVGCIAYNSKLGAAFKHQVTAFVMVGFRNASVIVSARGAVGKGKTSDLGMVRCCELVQERTSGYDLSRLATAIATSGDRFNRPPFYRIARNHDAGARDTEVDRLVEAVKLARRDYARILTSWLDEVLPPDLDEIVFCGGTCGYLEPELRAYARVAYSWHAGITVPPNLDPQGLGYRLADLWGLWSYFSSQFAATSDSGNQKVDLALDAASSVQSGSKQDNDYLEVADNNCSSDRAFGDTPTTEYERSSSPLLSANSVTEAEVSAVAGPYRSPKFKERNWGEVAGVRSPIVGQSSTAVEEERHG